MSVQIKQVIAKATGNVNYEDALKMITGPVMTIDKEFYLKQLSNIQIYFEKFILPEIKKLSEQEAIKLDRLYRQVDLSKVYVTRVKKSGKKTQKLRLHPQDIYNSEWFQNLRIIQKNGIKFCKQFNITKLGITDSVKEIINGNMQAARLFKFLGRTVLEDCTYSGNGELKVIAAAFAIREFTKKITEIVLTPMYDVRKYMETHWRDEISQVLNTRLSEETGKMGITDDSVRDALYTYVLFQYRLEVTNSPAEITKLLKKNLQFSQLDNFSASDLATIIEGFNLKAIDGNIESIEKLQNVAVKTLKDLDAEPKEGEEGGKKFTNALTSILELFNNDPMPEENDSEDEDDKKMNDLPEDVFDQ